ncbi:MAG: 3-deoxy-manno-octulosonate-8-phosphatase KdsC [Gammaproteobacteria bacterium]
MQDIISKARDIRLVIFDVDGVLTDGSLYLDDEGREYKAFNSKDGHGMAMLQRHGVTIAIITGRQSELVRIRMESLGISLVYQGARDKRPAFADLLRTTGLEPGQIAYVGDDVVDLPVMKDVGLAIAVQDAHDFVKKHAHWITPSAGGRGAARDVCELILDAHGKLQDEFATYLA